MPTQLAPMQKFLQKLDPMMGPSPLYQSLEFACVAARQGTNWVLVSGKAILNTEGCPPDAMLRPLVNTAAVLAITGRIAARKVHTLVDNLSQSSVITGLEGFEVRLEPEGTSNFSWSLPGVHSPDASSIRSFRWKMAYATFGNGPDRSALLHPSALEDTDAQLRKGNPAFNGFDGLCAKLGLAARRNNLGSAFYLAAELPARFVNAHIDATKTILDVEIDCVGLPDLMVEWLPEHDFKTIAAGWNSSQVSSQHHVSLAVPEGGTKANLILSFMGLEADTTSIDIPREKPSKPEPQSGTTPTKQHERWKYTGKTVGEGGQAQIFIVEDTQKEYTGQWALKRLKNISDPSRRGWFAQEVDAVRAIKHPNVLRVIDSDLTCERPYFVAEYCEGGSLQRNGAVRYRGDYAAMMQVVLPILDAIIAAHKVGIIHRDLKPANIMFRKDGTPVIGDFGICFMEGGKHHTLSNEGVGSRNFIAPEMESGQHNLGEATDRTDVYSLGKVIYWMLSGGREFAREEFPSLVDMLKDQRFEHVHKLLANLVVREPSKRVQSHEVRERLETTALLVERNSAPLSPSIGI